MQVNIDFTPKDISMWLSGVCFVLMALMKFSVDCSLCLDSAVRGFSMVVKYLESSYVGEPQNETMVTGLCQICVVSVVRTVSMVVAPNISVESIVEC